jgi:hypothetical protein
MRPDLSERASRSFKIGGISRRPQTWICVNRGTVTVMQGCLSQHLRLQLRGRCDADVPLTATVIRYCYPVPLARCRAGQHKTPERRGCLLGKNPQKDAACPGTPPDALQRLALLSDPCLRSNGGAPGIGPARDVRTGVLNRRNVVPAGRVLRGSRTTSVSSHWPSRAAAARHPPVPIRLASGGPANVAVVECPPDSTWIAPDTTPFFSESSDRAPHEYP